jgi:hypothetical protein
MSTHIKGSQKLSSKVGIVMAPLDNPQENIDNERLQRFQSLPFAKAEVLFAMALVSNLILRITNTDGRSQHIPR